MVCLIIVRLWTLLFKFHLTVYIVAYWWGFCPENK